MTTSPWLPVAVFLGLLACGGRPPAQAADGGTQRPPVLLAAGGFATCAARDTRTYCWGGVFPGGTGPLNFGLSPTYQPALSPAIDLAVSEYEACALHPDGGTTCLVSSPNALVTQRRVSGVAMTELEASATGPVCGRLADGHVMCWGENQFGQSGQGVSSGGLLGVDQQTAVSNIADAVDVKVGGYFACAERSDGAFSCWGMIGFPSTASGSDCFSYPCALTPVAASIPRNATLTLGGIGGCYLEASGELTCFGASVPPQFVADAGSGSYLPPSSYRIRSDVARVWAGYGKNCLRTQTGALLCWAGRDTGPDDAGFVPVPLSEVAFVTFGYGHFCALHGANSISCWGDNSQGQLGDGTTTTRGQPAPVQLPND